MKVLVAGETKGRLDLLFNRVATLHASKAGPFDALFITGEFFPPADEPEGGVASTAFEDYLMGVKEVPVPTYFMEGPSTSAEAKYGSVLPGSELCPNCKYLGPGGLELVGKLTVGYLSQRHTDKDIAKILEPASTSTFLGADLFFTTDWGQHVAAGHDSYLSESGISNAADVGSSTVADLAVVLRPRYHFAARPSLFFQRPPYKNHATKPKTKLSHVTRFVSLAPVSESKEKSKKWLHAISIEPLPYMTLEALVEEPVDVTESPYSVFKDAKRSGGEVGRQEEGGALKKLRGEAGGEVGVLNYESMQQIQREEESKRGDSGIFFWGGGKGGRGVGGGRGQHQQHQQHQQEVDPNCTTLHIAKLPVGFPAEDLQRGLSHYGTVTRVKVPEGKDFAFVSFGTHEEAKKALESRGITLGFQGAKMSWSKSSSRSMVPPVIGNGGPGGGGMGRGGMRGSMMAGPPLPPSPPLGMGGMGGGGGGHYGPASGMVYPQMMNMGGPGGGMGGGRGGPPPPPQSPIECWFCLGTEKAEVELLVTVGESLYMAVPKGPLCREHVLLIPINHVAGLAQLSPVEWEEFEKYTKALRLMYAEQKEGEEEGDGEEEGQRMVLFERRLETRGARHTHAQIIPVPAAKAAGVREAFEKRGEPLGVFFEHVPAGKSLPEMGLSPEQQYIYLEIPGLGGKGVARLLHRLPPGGRLPLTYGRDVLAELLGVPQKVNWKNCMLGKEAEKEMVERLKKEWEKWDFSEGE